MHDIIRPGQLWLNRVNGIVCWLVVILKIDDAAEAGITSRIVSAYTMVAPYDDTPRVFKRFASTKDFDDADRWELISDA